MERSTMLSMGKSTISMAMFNSYVTNYHIYLNNMAFKKTSNMTSDSQDLCLQPSCQWIVHPQQPKRSKDARDGHDLSSSYRPHHRPHHVSAVDVIGRSSQCHAKERMAACIYIYVIYMEYTIIYMYTIFYIIYIYIYVNSVYTCIHQNCSEWPMMWLITFFSFVQVSAMRREPLQIIHIIHVSNFLAWLPENDHQTI